MCRVLVLSQRGVLSVKIERSSSFDIARNEQFSARNYSLRAFFMAKKPIFSSIFY